MKEHTRKCASASKIVFEDLEAFIRGRVESWIQDLLEEELREYLGREKHGRRKGVDAPKDYRNGYGKPRRLSLQCGTITLQRPRTRGLEGRFESRLLPLFQRRTPEIGELIPDLYLHGLASGDFDLALRGLLGEGAPLSASSVMRLKTKWQADYEQWKRRSLLGEDDRVNSEDDRPKREEVVYLWVDGVYVKAGLEKEKAALLVAIGALRDGRKVVLTVESGHRESVESWSALLRGLKERGMNCPRLVIGDGHLGIWGALTNVYPETAEQRCWNHRILNVLDKLPKKALPTARRLLTTIPYADTRKQAEAQKKRFQDWCGAKGFEAAGKLLDKDWERMVAFYDFPKEHWKHLRTTNIIESPFAFVRLRTTAAKRFKKDDRPNREGENATAVLWKVLCESATKRSATESRFRRLDAPELVAEVVAGVTFVDGIRRTNTWEQAAD